MIDTDVLIWVLRRNQPSLDWLEALAAQGGLACSVLTVSEILRAAKQQELSRTHGVLQALDIVPVTYEDAILAADMMRQRGPGLVDSDIAAAAIRLQAHVVTYNRRDFERTPATLVPIPPSTP
jgi:predicted nucleic acid-binding protein